METPSLAPQFILPCDDDSHVLWFQKSNTYAVVSSNILNLVQSYLSTSKYEFLNTLKAQGTNEDGCNNYYADIKSWLVNVNLETIDTAEAVKMSCLDVISKAERNTTPITIYYSIYHNNIQINFPNKNIKEIVHPQLKHYQTFQDEYIKYVEFDIVCRDVSIILYINNVFKFSCNLKDTHILLGKLSLQLACLFYNKVENDWLATFHASTLL